MTGQKSEHKVLYISYGGGHANLVRHVYREMAGNPGFEQKVVALTAAGKIFHRYGVPCSRIMDYIDIFDHKKEILSRGRELAETAFQPEAGIPYEDLVVYLGTGFCDLQEEAGEQTALELYAQKGRKAFCPVRSMKRILEYERPGVLVITCGVRMEKAAGIAANQLGIPVVRIADLPVFEASGCDCTTCVMNAYGRDYAVGTLGLPGEKVVVTGQPVFEDNLQIDLEELHVRRRELGADKFSQVVLYLEEPGLEETAAVESYLEELAGRRKDMLLLVKLHPNQTGTVCGRRSGNVVYLQDYPLKYLLYLCSVAVTRDSTAGLEAALVGKPLINLLLSRTELDYSKYGISFKVTELDRLEAALTACFTPDSEENRGMAAGRHRFRNEKNAAEKIAAVIKSKLMSGMPAEAGAGVQE